MGCAHAEVQLRLAGGPHAGREPGTVADPRDFAALVRDGAGRADPGVAAAQPGEGAFASCRGDPGFSPDVERSLPDHTCRTCGTHDAASVLRCRGDGRWYCNSRARRGARNCIISHLVRTGQSEVQTHINHPLGEINLECWVRLNHSCTLGNLFSLGYVVDPREASVVLLCSRCFSQ